MMTERLKAFVESAEQLPADKQDQLVAEIEDLLEDARWDSLFADPRSEAFFDELAAEAQRGPLRPFPKPADISDDEPVSDGN